MTEQDRDDMELQDSELTDETAAEVEVEIGEEGLMTDEDGVSREVQELREELDALNDRHLRLAAEFDNYRKRNRRDRALHASQVQADLVGSLLDVLDDLQRVAYGGEGVEVEAVLEGIRLVEKKFMTALEAAGVAPVDADGARFDPEVMEAVAMVATDDPAKDGHVADVFQRGYRLREILVRPARVRVYQHDETE
jgi:molecular chaperone GrpE